MNTVTKLNRANALLYKIRNYVSFNNLKAIYFAIFDSHINYANLVWEHVKNYYFTEKSYNNYK